MVHDARPARLRRDALRRLQGTATLATVAVIAVLALQVDAAAPAETAWPTDELIALTNADRTSNGLPALLIDPRLMEVAQTRSDDMLARGYFDHAIPPDGHTVWDILRGIGLGGIWGGENLHLNTLPRAQSVSFAERALMLSPEHRANILERNFDSLGIGVAFDEVAGRSIYTILFARLESPGQLVQPAPPAPALAKSSAPAPQLPLPATSGQPPGLVDDIVQRTLRQYLGL
jgi:uncharacterized protein YkwD